jgi:hypothetical protein
MAPSDLKYLVGQLTLKIQSCDDLCNDIHKYRRLGAKHENLDSLQLELRSSGRSISQEFSAQRKVYGSRFEHGDDISKALVNSSITKISDIEQRLNAIARRENEGSPGFSNMLKKLRAVEDDVHEMLSTLGPRLDYQAPKAPPKRDEAKIQARDVERYVAHMKNSWAEKLIDGRIFYENALDPNLDTWECPKGGYIKKLPELKSALKKRAVFEEPIIRPNIETPGYRRPAPIPAGYKRPTVEDDGYDLEY